MRPIFTRLQSALIYTRPLQAKGGIREDLGFTWGMARVVREVDRGAWESTLCKLDLQSPRDG